jgi:branched-chain amino acid transport system substrate-binding protein
MGDEGSRFDLPKAARAPLGGGGQGGSEEREFLRRLGGLPPPNRKPQVRSRSLGLKYWLLAGPAILAIVVSIGIYTLVPGLKDGKFTLAAVPSEPSSVTPPPTATGDDKIQPSPAKWSDHAAQLQLAPGGAASPEASVLATTGSSVGRSTSPGPHDVVSTSVAAVSSDAPSPVQTLAPEAGVRGVSEKEILFGIAAPFSGASRELGREMKIGIETAFNQINDAGGANGRLLRLMTADDGYEPTRTADVMKVLYDKDQVFGFIGNVGTPTAAVALPFALDHRALFFGAFTGAGLLRRDPPDRYVFNYRASYAEETNAVVHYLVKVRRIQPKEIVVFAQQDSYGDSGYAGVQKAVRSLPGDNPDIVRLNYKRNTVDVQDAVDALRAYKGQIKAVVMVASYRAAAKFIEKTRDLYPGMIYTNVSFVGSTALADELMLLGPRYAAGTIVTQVVPAINSHASIVLKFKEALAKYFPGESPDYVSFEGYIDASILAEAVKRAGRDINTEKLVDELEQIHAIDLGLGAPVTFSENEHQGSHKVWGTQLDETGHYQPIDLE